jgi:putative ATP-dependent endonuclease of OLD family
VIECFSPEQINILKRTETGVMTTAKVDLSEGLKAKTYRKFVRKALAEGMLSNGVIVGEGITEVDILVSDI